MLTDLLTPLKSNFKSYTELRAQENRTRQVTLLAGNMVANAQKTEGGVSARVYNGGTYGYACGAEYSSKSVQNVLNAATANAEFMNKNVNKGISV